MENFDKDKAYQLMQRMGLINEYDFSLRHKFKVDMGDTVDSILTEGVYKSYDGNQILNILKKHYDIEHEPIFLKTGHEIGVSMSVYGGPADSTKLPEICTISLVVPKDFPDTDKIKKFFTTCGWRQSENDFVYDGDENYVVLPFEKDRQYNTIETGKFVYHLTPSSRIEKILKNGLVPRSGNKPDFQHIERIYVFLEKPTAWVSHLFARDMWLAELEQQTLDKGGVEKMYKEGVMPKYALLEIDVEKCGDIKFYGDPDLAPGAWTMDNIPPEAITVLNDKI